MGAVGLRRKRGVGLLRLQRVHLLAQLTLAHLPAALLRVAPVLGAGGNDTILYRFWNIFVAPRLNLRPPTLVIWGDQGIAAEVLVGRPAPAGQSHITQRWVYVKYFLSEIKKVFFRTGSRIYSMVYHRTVDSRLSYRKNV